MYRGIGAAIIGGTPGTVLYLTSYDYLKSSLPLQSSPFLCHLSAGMLAEAVACVVYVPVDVVKERCQVSTLQAKPKYSTSYGALKYIMENEGTRGVYRGYAATLLSFGPFSGLYFGFYEELKSKISPYYPKGELPFTPTVATSVGAGLCAAWITTPLDLAKLRMQVVRGGGNFVDASAVESYATFLSSLKTIVREGGVQGLWRGATARCLFFAPATGVTMTCFDMFKQRLNST